MNHFLVGSPSFLVQQPGPPAAPTLTTESKVTECYCSPLLRTSNLIGLHQRLRKNNGKVRGTAKLDLLGASDCRPGSRCAESSGPHPAGIRTRRDLSTR